MVVPATGEREPSSHEEKTARGHTVELGTARASAGLSGPVVEVKQSAVEIYVSPPAQPDHGIRGAATTGGTQRRVVPLSEARIAHIIPRRERIRLGSAKDGTSSEGAGRVRNSARRATGAVAQAKMLGGPTGQISPTPVRRIAVGRRCSLISPNPSRDRPISGRRRSLATADRPSGAGSQWMSEALPQALQARDPSIPGRPGPRGT
ncbi:hypothetical protein ACCO45_002443 [Purpureocillium lilacinum]|uniref:Uncharacterized protein n=1 Tax=Purpureocillium lilacinum TaxID=33203 RepID=A0ACC4EB54_PURLI